MSVQQIASIEKAKHVSDYARHTTGSGTFYRHWLFGQMLYTEGVHFMAETCGAHWLVDAVASHLTKKRVRREPFQVWRLHRPKGAWVLDAWTDTPETAGNLIVRQRIGYSDFPVELAPFNLYLEAGGDEAGNRTMTLMLPEER